MLYIMFLILPSVLGMVSYTLRAPIANSAMRADLLLWVCTLHCRVLIPVLAQEHYCHSAGTFHFDTAVLRRLSSTAKQAWSHRINNLNTTSLSHACQLHIQILYQDLPEPCKIALVFLLHLTKQQALRNGNLILSYIWYTSRVIPEWIIIT